MTVVSGYVILSVFLELSFLVQTQMKQQNLNLKSDFIL